MIHLLSSIALGPLLLAQGKYVRSNIELLPEPEGERIGTKGSGPHLSLLIVGDSAAAGVGSDRQRDALLGQLVTRLACRHTVHFQLEACTGDTSDDCLQKLRQLGARHYDVVLTSLGVNDVTSGSSKATFERRQRTLITLFKDKFSAKQIILSGLPPVGHFPALPQPLRWYLGSRARHFDGILQRLSHELGLAHIKLDLNADTNLAASDGFHPGPAAYAQWAELAEQQILDSL